jgi:hypothetical protein
MRGERQDRAIDPKGADAKRDAMGDGFPESARVVACDPREVRSAVLRRQRRDVAMRRHQTAICSASTTP